jgi:hypothetical protein
MPEYASSPQDTPEWSFRHGLDNERPKTVGRLGKIGARSHPEYGGSDAAFAGQGHHFSELFAG